MPGMVLVLNRYRQIVFANQAFYQLSGRSESENLLGMLIGDVLVCHIALESAAGCGTGESCETCGALVAMMSGLSGIDNVQECTLSQQDGTAVKSLTLRMWSTPLKYGGEEFTVLAGMDISHERRRLALEKTFFHDILNLVASIQGFAELIEIDEDIEIEINKNYRSDDFKFIDTDKLFAELLSNPQEEVPMVDKTKDCGDQVLSTMALKKPRKYDET